MTTLVRALLLILVVLLALGVGLAFLIARVPASAITAVLPNDQRIGTDGPYVTRLAGTLWSGELSLAATVTEAPVVDVHWTLRLLSSPPHVQIRALGVPGSVSGRLRAVRRPDPTTTPVTGSDTGWADFLARTWQIRVHVDSLEGDLAALNRWLRGVGVDVTGAVTGGDFSFDLSRAGIAGLATTLRYEGGRNFYEFGREWYEIMLPPLEIELSGAGGRLNGVIVDGTTPMLEFDLDGLSGRYALSVREHAVRLSGHPLPIGADTNDVAAAVEGALWH